MLGIPVYLDRGLTEETAMTFESGLDRETVSMPMRDYVRARAAGHRTAGASAARHPSDRCALSHVTAFPSVDVQLRSGKDRAVVDSRRKMATEALPRDAQSADSN
jgi:hypothetical protein